MPRGVGTPRGVDKTGGKHVRFRVEAAEVQRVSRTYIVDANSPAEANAKASRGDTIEEFDALKEPEVMDRIVFDVRPDDDDG